MWWNRKKQDPKPDWQQEAINEMIAFRKRGETLTYLGVKMIVSGYWRVAPLPNGFELIPTLICDYVDVHGVLHQVGFGIEEMSSLVRGNEPSNTSPT